MGLDVYFIPALDMQEIKKDENIVMDGSFIQLKDNNESKIRGYYENPDDYEDYFRISSDSIPIIRYLCEKYNLLVGGDGLFNDAGYCFMMDALHYGTYNYATVITEMLKYRETYGWSDEYIKKLEERLNG